MNKSKFLPVLTLMIAATLIVGSNSKAAELAPGEGYFAGLFLGFGQGVLQAKVTTSGNAHNGRSASETYDQERGGVGLSGIQGGGWAGWGTKTADDIYLGGELSLLGSEEQFKLTTTKGLRVDDGTSDAGAVANITEISVRRQASLGAAFRAGYYVNKDTLFALKGGIAVSTFEVNIGSSEETYIAGGPQFGGSVETRLSKIDPNLSLRMELVYTNYLTANVFGAVGQGSRGASTGGASSELTGHDSAGRIGVQYSF